MHTWCVMKRKSEDPNSVRVQNKKQSDEIIFLRKDSGLTKYDEIVCFIGTNVISSDNLHSKILSTSMF